MSPATKIRTVASLFEVACRIGQSRTFTPDECALAVKLLTSAADEIEPMSLVSFAKQGEPMANVIPLPSRRVVPINRHPDGAA